MENPYERLKELTRGQAIDAVSIRAFVATLALPDDLAERLSNLTPGTYVGLAQKLVEDYLD